MSAPHMEQNVFVSYTGCSYNHDHCHQDEEESQNLCRLHFMFLHLGNSSVHLLFHIVFLHMLAPSCPWHDPFLRVYDSKYNALLFHLFPAFRFSQTRELHAADANVRITSKPAM